MSAEHNFVFPVRTLANDRVKLVPFNIERHVEAFFASSSPHPELYAHMPIGPFTSKEHFLEQMDSFSSRKPDFLTLAVIDKTRPPSDADDEGGLAGMMTFMDASTTHLSTELGFIVVLPAFHRTHVASNAVGLMLQQALDGVQDGGWGLRRVQWKASAANAASVRIAERMGFRKEGLLRWHFVLRNDAEKQKVGHGRKLPPGSKEGDLGRDTVVLGLCWDDWQDGGRDVVQKVMDRRV